MIRANSEIHNSELVFDCMFGSLNRCLGTIKPNVGRTESGNKTRLYALSDIKKGEDIILINAQRVVNLVDDVAVSDKIFAMTYIKDGDEIIFPIDTTNEGR